MSRTFRRVNAQHHYAWVLRDWKWNPDHGWMIKIRIDQHSHEGRKKLAHYHSDAGFGSMKNMSPPHWYRRLCNKRFTMAEQQRLHRWKREGGDVVLNPRVKNASWWW